MNIDIHGHYTTAPKSLAAWRKRQIEAFDLDGSRVDPAELVISDDEIRESIDNGQLPLQRERETDITLFSPTAGGMAHHYGDEQTSIVWTGVVNDLIHRVCELYPTNFVGVAQLPQSPGVPPGQLDSRASTHRRGAGFRRREPQPGSIGRLLDRAEPRPIAPSTPSA